MTDPAPPAAPATPLGQVHDLSYRRYAGRRLGHATRFLVIARYALMMQWRQRAVKLFLLGSLLVGGITAAVLGAMWALSGRVGEMSPDAARELESYAVTAALNAQWVPAFLLVLVCGAPAVAADLKAGAFQFHFARPVSVGHYVLGRLVGATAWAALFTFGTLGVLCVERVALSSDLGALARLLGVGAAAAAMRVVTLGAVALGCSSLTRRAGLAQAMFAAVVVGSGMFASILASQQGRAWFEAVSVMGASRMLAEQLLGRRAAQGPVVLAALGSTAAWTGLFLGLTAARLRRVEVVKG